MRETPDGSDDLAVPSFRLRRLKSALQCVGAMVLFWVVVVFTPWTSVWAGVFGLAVWMAWVPALVVMSIAACLICMSFKDVFGDGLLDDWVVPIAGIALGASVLMGVVGHNGGDYLERRSAASGRVGSESGFWKHAADHEDRRTFVDARNVCRDRVQAFLDGTAKRDKSRWEYDLIQAVEITVNGKRVTDSTSVCDSLFNNRVVFSLVPKPQDMAVEAP